MFLVILVQNGVEDLEQTSSEEQQRDSSSPHSAGSPVSLSSLQQHSSSSSSSSSVSSLSGSDIVSSWCSFLTVQENSLKAHVSTLLHLNPLRQPVQNYKVCCHLHWLCNLPFDIFLSLSLSLSGF